MSQTQKFTQEELEQIKKLRDSNQGVMAKFGQLEIDLILARQDYENLVKEKEKINVEFTDLQKQEKTLVETLNKKYGAGTVNLQSGEFTPAK
tara:strand:+ start:214 stop:489 length:276 start_codon:yes stop_codon:yes gene_type:complete